MRWEPDSRVKRHWIDQQKSCPQIQPIAGRHIDFLIF